MDGYNIPINNSQVGLDGYVFTWNGVTGGNWTLPGATTNCAGSPIMPGVVYVTPAYPAQFIHLDFNFDEPKKEEVSAGCACKKCKEFNEYASPNQDDKTFICYACLHNL